MLTIRHTCSWCHTLADGPFCPQCGHRADKARLDCDCPRCAARRSATEPTEADIRAALDFGRTIDQHVR